MPFVLSWIVSSGVDEAFIPAEKVVFVLAVGEVKIPAVVVPTVASVIRPTPVAFEVVPTLIAADEPSSKYIPVVLGRGPGAMIDEASS